MDLQNADMAFIKCDIDVGGGNSYKEYLDSWLYGIYGEIEFWDAFFKTKGANCNVNISRFNEVTQYEPEFRLEEDIENDKTKFLDVGSGPYSRCGIKTNLYLDFIAVDPLASVYKILKSKYAINTKITPETAMVENLSSKFKENEFDIVHMSNSLDHSFDPMLGLWQMLYVCKIGGKIILKHHQNEAENENYQGFHQWNLANEDGKFVIWRKNIKLDIAHILKDYAKVEYIRAEKENTSAGWEYNKVVIRKIKPCNLHFNENYPMLLERILEQICALNYEMFQKNDYKVVNFLGLKILR